MLHSKTHPALIVRGLQMKIRYYTWPFSPPALMGSTASFDLARVEILFVSAARASVAQGFAAGGAKVQKEVCQGC